MKKILTSPVLYIALALFGCQEGKESNHPSNNVSTYATIGHQIPTETGMRWIDLYNTQNNVTAGRSLLTPYSISESLLNNSLASVPDLIGVAFHHATDD